MARSGFKTGSVWVQHQGTSPFHHRASQAHSAALTKHSHTLVRNTNKMLLLQNIKVHRYCDFNQITWIVSAGSKIRLDFLALGPELRPYSTCRSVHTDRHTQIHMCTHPRRVTEAQLHNSKLLLMPEKKCITLH